MKKTTLLLTAILTMFFTLGLQSQVYVKYRSHDHRGPDARINKKIKKGIRSGELTRNEVKDLKREFKYIQKMKKRAWRDGHLSRRERRKINHAMDDFDRMLYRYMHNRKHRHDRHYRDYGYQDWERSFNDGYYDDEYRYYHKNGKKKGKGYRDRY